MSEAASITGLDDLRLDPHNANKGTDRGRALVAASLEECGAGRSILADRNGTIIAGNKTLEAAKRLGLPVRMVETTGDELVVVRRTDLSLGEEKARRLAEPTGEDPGADLDHAEQLRAKWGVQIGQVWRVGNHRVLCGDATDPACFVILMAGECAEVLWTDPPYGVDYVGGTAEALTIANDSAEGLPALLKAFCAAVAIALAPSARFYIAAPAGPQGTVFREAIRDAGWRLHQALVWVKSSLVLGHSDYHYQHEDVLYGYLPGEGRPGRGNHAGRKWYGDNAQTTVFQVDKPNRNDSHPTTKPTDLILPMLRNSARRGDIVLDPFLGSGSTMVAAEQRGGRCYGMEIDPRYVAVTLERMSGMGLEPALLEG